MTGAQVGIIAYGSSDPAVEEARVTLDKQRQLPTDYLRLRGLPIDVETKDFIANHKVVYVVEQNRDAQCASILRLECPEHATRLKSLLHYNGMPIDAQSIVDDLIAAEN